MTETKTEATLSLTHHAEAPIERVFRAFTAAAELKRWFGPERLTIKSAEMDTRVGGTYRIEMQSPDGEIYTVKGTIQELSEPHTIAYTWAWEADDEADEHESLVTSNSILQQAAPTSSSFTASSPRTKAPRVTAKAGPAHSTISIDFSKPHEPLNHSPPIKGGTMRNAIRTTIALVFAVSIVSAVAPAGAQMDMEPSHQL